MKKLSELKDFEGTDASLDTALYEYGLIWKEVEPDNYLFYYGIPTDDYSNFKRFDCAYMSKDEWIELLNESWVDIEAVENFADITKQELIETFPTRVDTLVLYYGYENVFGSSYWPFEIDAKC